MRRAIYPGSFDPITNGHIDIIERAVHLFDHLVVAVGRNAEKGPSLFSEKERLDLIQQSVKKMPSVDVDVFEGLMVNHALKHGAVAAIRGLRALSDFEFEISSSTLEDII